MSDDSGMPPLVDAPYTAHPNHGGWPMAPGTPMWGIPAAAQYAPTWGTFPSSPWAAAAAGATPMFPQQPMPGWPTGASPAVTQVPIPTGVTSVAQGNDGWVHVQPAVEQVRNAYPEGFGAETLSRSISRRSSSRPRTPFSEHSSPSSGVSDLSRARSWTGSVRETDKRPPREWRSDFSMSRSPISSALGSLLQLSPRPSRRGASACTI